MREENKKFLNCKMTSANTGLPKEEPVLFRGSIVGGKFGNGSSMDEANRAQYTCMHAIYKIFNYSNSMLLI